MHWVSSYSQAILRYCQVDSLVGIVAALFRWRVERVADRRRQIRLRVAFQGRAQPWARSWAGLGTGFLQRACRAASDPRGRRLAGGRLDYQRRRGLQRCRREGAGP